MKTCLCNPFVDRNQISITEIIVTIECVSGKGKNFYYMSQLDCHDEFSQQIKKNKSLYNFSRFHIYRPKFGF